VRYKGRGFFPGTKKVLCVTMVFLCVFFPRGRIKILEKNGFFPPPLQSSLSAPPEFSRMGRGQGAQKREPCCFFIRQKRCSEFFPGRPPQPGSGGDLQNSESSLLPFGVGGKKKKIYAVPLSVFGDTGFFPRPGADARQTGDSLARKNSLPHENGRTAGTFLFGFGTGADWRSQTGGESPQKENRVWVDLTRFHEVLPRSSFFRLLRFGPARLNRAPVPGTKRDCFLSSGLSRRVGCTHQHPSAHGFFYERGTYFCAH